MYSPPKDDINIKFIYTIFSPLSRISLQSSLFLPTPDLPLWNFPTVTASAPAVISSKTFTQATLATPDQTVVTLIDGAITDPLLLKLAVEQSKENPDALNYLLAKAEQIPKLLQQLTTYLKDYPHLLSALLEKGKQNYEYLLALIDRAVSDEELRKILEEPQYRAIWEEELKYWGDTLRGQSLSPQEQIHPLQHILGIRLYRNAMALHEIEIANDETSGESSPEYISTLFKAAKFGSFDALRNLEKVHLRYINASDDLEPNRIRVIYNLFKQGAIKHGAPGHMLASTICLAVAHFYDRKLKDAEDVDWSIDYKNKFFHSQSLLFYELAYKHAACAGGIEGGENELRNAYALNEEIDLQQIFESGLATHYKLPATINSFSTFQQFLLQQYLAPIAVAASACQMFSQFVNMTQLTTEQITQQALQELAGKSAVVTATPTVEEVVTSTPVLSR